MVSQNDTFFDAVRRLCRCIATRDYSRARMAEDPASKIAIGLAETLRKTVATSIDGATAKLHAMLAQSEPGSDYNEFPWDQIRSVLTDLLTISAGTRAP